MERRRVVGWSPNGDESIFVISPKRFAEMNRLSPCQSGVVRYLSRFQYERNPWLLQESGLLIELMLEFGPVRVPFYKRYHEHLGWPVYLAPQARYNFLETMNVTTYCVINGIDQPLLLPMGLVCNEPTRKNLRQALKLIDQIS